MQALWSQTGRFLIEDKYARIALVNSDKRLPTQTMMSMARARLPCDFDVSAGILETIERELLWPLIVAYCRENVTIISDATASGLADKQRTTLMTLFGFHVPQWGHFKQLIKHSIFEYMELFGVKRQRIVVDYNVRNGQRR